MKGNGRFYQGRENATKGGLECQPWYTAQPHAHSSPPPVFPEMKNASNFCRNGGGIESGPWCYTMDPLVRWQHCDITTCGNVMVWRESVIIFTLLQLRMSPMSGTTTWRWR